MTILICGASGILGRQLMKVLTDKQIDYIGTYNSNKMENCISLDFSNINNIEKILLEHNITCCINCIVERQVETCENDWKKTKTINIDITNNIAKVCNKYHIYFSIFKLLLLLLLSLLLLLFS
jgi:dTDP-4-dehydrorhamnose reductase